MEYCIKLQTGKNNALKSSFSLKELTGQMLMAGFEGTTLTPQTEDLIRNRHVGGLILFGRNYENPTQLLNLIKDLQGLALSLPAAQPLFISVDQEGGRVARLKKPFTDYPPICCIGNSRSEDLAYHFGKALAVELKSVGINKDYAPVLDVNTNPQNPIIGDRALSNQPEQVARLGISMMRGFKETGVIPVGKHFPGHGDTTVDSHLDLPYVTRDASSLEQTELYPFAQAIRSGLDIIMTAHVIYTAWDDKYPATFSRVILQDILRGKLGYQGIILSDDLEMKAIEHHFPFESLPTLGVEAGLDQFMICNNPDKVKALQDQMMLDLEQGRIPIEKVERSVQRILAVKSRIDRTLPPEPDVETWAKPHQKLAEEIKSYAQ